MKRRVLAAILSLVLLDAAAVVPCVAQSSSETTALSNKGRTGSQPYVTAGDRTYLIGTQDGNFPDMGQHVPGEMGGLWLPPIKLIDAFHARIAEGTNEEVSLAESAEMVTYPYGTRFIYGRVLDAIEIERFQFSPDGRPGLIVQYLLKNSSDRARTLRLHWSVKTDLRPGWYADRVGIKDGQDRVEWRATEGVFVARDADHPWFCVWGVAHSTDARRIERPSPIHTKGRGVTAASTHMVTVDAHSTATLTFVVSGSTTGSSDAVSNYTYLSEHHVELLAQKTAHYGSLTNRARLRIPDPRLQEVYNWSRINMEWLVREVPGIGRGLSGAFMEYPWWFGTETYSLQALTVTGDFELARQTLRLLRNVSEKVNGNGRIVHEITPDAAVSNPGNTQETAQFILTVGKIFQWTGDPEFAREMYPAIKKSIDWLLGEMDQDNDLFPEGYGIMEVSGLNAELIDVAVYTQQALVSAARIAEELNDTDAKDRYRKLAADLKERINQKFWIEQDDTYADFYGSRSQAVSAAEGAIRQIGLQGADKLTQKDKDLIAHYQRQKAQFSAMPDINRGWLTNKNWVIATPMETGIAPPARAIPLLDKIRRENSGEYGPYLSAVEKQAMMTIATGVQAVAEGNYGRTDQAMWYVDRIVQTFNRVTPGSISEMMPDYGCFTIAWTSYGIVMPLIEHVFGIQPDAPNKTIVFEPHLPSGWEDISINDLPVGDNLVSFSRTRTGAGVIYDIEARDGDWRFVLRMEPAPNTRLFLNGRPRDPSSSDIHMEGTKNRVLITSTH
jgi:glycogen debranching enzyme